MHVEGTCRANKIEQQGLLVAGIGPVVIDIVSLWMFPQLEVVVIEERNKIASLNPSIEPSPAKH